MLSVKKIPAKKLFTSPLFLPPLLFFLGWLPLNRWYAYQRPIDYILSAMAFVPACLIAFYPVLPWIRNVSAQRKIITICLLFLALPWSEWFQLNFFFSRLDWSRQIYLHAVILYLLTILFRSLNHFWQALYTRFIRLLEIISSKSSIVWIPCLIFFFLTSWISLFVYRGTFLVQDSAAHMFQAKIFAEGKYFAPAPPITDFFSANGDMLVIRNGMWFGMYLPGFAAMLAAAMKIHAEWILCPFLGAISIAIWIGYARRWHDNGTALILAVLCMLSPFLLLMSSTIMVHNPELFFVSASVYLLRAESESSSRWNKTLIGLILAAGLVVRGFSILAFIAPLLLYSFWAQRKEKRAGFLIFAAASLLAATIVVAFFQWKTSGNPFLPGYSLEYKDPLIYGFGKTVVHQIHTPLRGLENISNDLLGLDYWLNGWYCGSYVFLIFFVLFCRWSIWDRLLLISCFSVLVFYYFYLFQDLIIGPRFLYPIAPVALLFVARSILIPITSEIQIPPFPFFLFLFALVTFVPFRLGGFITKYEPSKMQAGALKKEIETRGSIPTIAFLEKNISQQFVNWNDPWLRKPVIVLRDLGHNNQEALKTFPGRKPVYFGLKISLDRGSKDYGFKFRNERSHPSSGSISLMQIAFAMSASIQYPDQDLVDHAFPILLDGSPAGDQMKFLNRQLEEAGVKKTRSSFFRMGLIYSSRAMLLLKQSYEQNSDEWFTNFPYEDFRQTTAKAILCFRQAGEPGKQLIQALDKVKMRIDRNDDAFLSNKELKRYLRPKVKMSEISDW